MLKSETTRITEPIRATNGTRLFSGTDYLIFLLLLVSCAGAFVALPPLGLTSNDEGARYVQMKNFALHGALPIEYPGQAIGLSANDVAKDQDGFVERGGKLYITYPPLFTYLSSLAYPLLGDRVTTLLPLLAVSLCVVILAGTLKLLVQGGLFYYVLLFGFLVASPVYPFAIRFVEHVPAVFLVLLSLYFLVRYFRIKPSLSNLCLSASLLSAGVFFRPEVVLLAMPFTAYVSVTLCAQREARKAGAVIACSVVPILLYALINQRLYGSTLLLHLLYNSLGFHLSRGQAGLAVGTLLFVGLLALLTRRCSEESLTKERVYGFIPVLFIPFMLFVSTRSPVPALFLAFPLLLIIFFAISRRGEKLLSEPMSLGNILFVTVSSFLLLVSWLFADNAVGSIGYCLVVIPFVIVFVGHEEKNITSSRPMVTLVLALLVFSACYSAYTLKSVTWRYKQYNAERIAFLKAQTKPGDIVICDSQPRLEHAGPLFFERIFMVADSPCQLSRVVTLLKEKEIERAYLWAGFRGLSAGNSYSRPRPLVFSSKHGPENYLSSVTLVPPKEGTAGGPSPTLTSCSGRGSTPRLQ
jgi:hypothetical protein